MDPLSGQRQPFKFWFFVERDGDDSTFWNGRIPGIGGHETGYSTCAKSLQKLLENAVDLCDLWVIDCWESGRDPLQPAVPKSQRSYQVGPSLPVRAAWLVRRLRLGAGLTQSQAAEKVKINQQAYSRLENPSKSNATVKTLERVAKALGKRIEVSLA